MAISFGEFIASPLFTFQVGDEKRDFIVHSEPFARLSQTLKNLITGDMIEAESRRVVWQDVSQETFFRLCEYAYLHDYTPPSCGYFFHEDMQRAGSPWGDTRTRKSIKKAKKKWGHTHRGEWSPSPPAESQDEVAAETTESVTEYATEYVTEDMPEDIPDPPATEDDWGCPPIPRQQKIISEPKLLESFSLLKLSTDPQKATDQFSPRENTNSNQDFTPVFLGHAQLWVLADKYQIDALCSLVLHKLYQSLEAFTLYSTSTPTIIEFLKFVYSNTRSPESGINDLRNLAVCYAASVVGRIGDTEEFKQMLAEGGDFVMDFWNVVWVNNKCE